MLAMLEDSNAELDKSLQNVMDRGDIDGDKGTVATELDNSSAGSSAHSAGTSDAMGSSDHKFRPLVLSFEHRTMHQSHPSMECHSTAWAYPVDHLRRRSLQTRSLGSAALKTDSAMGSSAIDQSREGLSSIPGEGTATINRAMDTYARAMNQWRIDDLDASKTSSLDDDMRMSHSHQTTSARPCTFQPLDSSFNWGNEREEDLTHLDLTVRESGSLLRAWSRESPCKKSVFAKKEGNPVAAFMNDRVNTLANNLDYIARKSTRFNTFANNLDYIAGKIKCKA